MVRLRLITWKRGMGYFYLFFVCLVCTTVGLAFYRRTMASVLPIWYEANSVESSLSLTGFAYNASGVETDTDTDTSSSTSTLSVFVSAVINDEGGYAKARQHASATIVDGGIFGVFSESHCTAPTINSSTMEAITGGDMEVEGNTSCVSETYLGLESSGSCTAVAPSQNISGLADFVASATWNNWIQENGEGGQNQSMQIEGAMTYTGSRYGSTSVSLEWFGNVITVTEGMDVNYYYGDNPSGDSGSISFADQLLQEPGDTVTYSLTLSITQSISTEEELRQKLHDYYVDLYAAFSP